MAVNKKLAELSELQAPQASALLYGVDPDTLEDFEAERGDVVREILTADNLDVRTFSEVDLGAYLAIDNAVYAVRTVPEDGTFNYGLGTIIAGYQAGTGAVEFDAEPGVTIIQVDGFNGTRGQGADFQLKKILPNTWVLTGELTTVAPPSSEVLFDGAASTLNAPTLDPSQTVATWGGFPVGGEGYITSATALPDTNARLISFRIGATTDPDARFVIGLADPGIDLDNSASWDNLINLFQVTPNNYARAQGDVPPGADALGPLFAFPGQVVRVFIDGTSWALFIDDVPNGDPSKAAAPLASGNFNPAHTLLVVGLLNDNLGSPINAEIEIESSAADLIAQGFSTRLMGASTQSWGGGAIGLQGEKQPIYGLFLPPPSNPAQYIPARLSNNRKTIDLTPTVFGVNEVLAGAIGWFYGPEFAAPVAMEWVIDSISVNPSAGVPLFFLFAEQFFGTDTVGINYQASGAVGGFDSDGGFSVIAATAAAGDRFGVEINPATGAYNLYYKPAAGIQVTVLSGTLSGAPVMRGFVAAVQSNWGPGSLPGDSVVVTVMQDSGDYALSYSPGTTNLLGEAI